MKEIDFAYCPKNEEAIIVTPTGKRYSTDNDIEFNYIRGQISRWNLEGYKVIFKDIEYPIDNNGNIEDWPEGLFTNNDELLSYILRYGVFNEVEDSRIDDTIFSEVQEEYIKNLL